MSSAPMTVAMLMAELSQYQPDMRVVVSGFDESGFDDARVGRVLVAGFDQPSTSWIAAYGEPPDGVDGVRAVLIDFGSANEWDAPHPGVGDG